MKIVFVTPLYGYYLGGVEIHIKNVAERLVKRGYDIEIYATDPNGNLPKREVINGVKVKRFRSYARNEAYYLPSLSLLNSLKTTEADIIHAHHLRALPLIYACLGKNDSQRLILTTHSAGTSSRFRDLLLKLYLRIIKRIISKKADVIICVSEYEKEIIINRLGIDNNKVIVIPNGVDNDIFNIKRKDNGFNLLSVSRLEKYKNLDKVVESLYILHKNGYKDTKLTIIGNGPDKTRLISIINKLGLKNNVILKSNLTREELLNEYTKAKVFLLPSEYESYGIAAVEAIAMKIPTIVNINTALREFVDRGSAIGIEPPITADKIANAIIDAMDFKPNDARDKIITWDEVVDRLEYIYAEKRIERI